VTGTNDPTSGAAVLRRCRACERELAPAEVGWECECGIVVCGDAACFDEFFKAVAGGEATRCRTCGLVT
jgi:hypothetical protein